MSSSPVLYEVPDGPPLPYDPRYRCTRLATSTGKRCRRRAIPGGVICKKHGGGAPQVQAAARRRLERDRLEGQVGALCREMGEDVPESPVDGLAELYRMAMAKAMVLDRLADRLGLGASAGVTDAGLPGPALYGPNHLGDGAPHVLATMAGEWLDRAGRIAKMASDAGIDVRRMELDEWHGEVIAAVIGTVLRRYGQDPGDADVQAAVAAELGRVAKLDYGAALDLPASAVQPVKSARAPDFGPARPVSLRGE